MHPLQGYPPVCQAPPVGAASVSSCLFLGLCTCTATWWFPGPCTRGICWCLCPRRDFSVQALSLPPQGKEEFEKTQKELLEKGNIIRQGKGQLELQQVRLPILTSQ